MIVFNSSLSEVVAFDCQIGQANIESGYFYVSGSVLLNLLKGNKENIASVTNTTIYLNGNIKCCYSSGFYGDLWVCFIPKDLTAGTYRIEVVIYRN